MEQSGGETNRRAGVYGMMETDDYSCVSPKDTVNSTKSANDEDVDWREKLSRDDTFASVRDVKNASAKCVICSYPFSPELH